MLLQHDNARILMLAASQLIFRWPRFSTMQIISTTFQLCALMKEAMSNWRWLF
jgi:hypothetical protein